MRKIKALGLFIEVCFSRKPKCKLIHYEEQTIYRKSLDRKHLKQIEIEGDGSKQPTDAVVKRLTWKLRERRSDFWTVEVQL